MEEDTRTASDPKLNGLEVSLREACVVQIYGGEIGRRYPIIGEVTVGRNDHNSVVLDDMDTVSRQHARFFAAKETFYVADCGSTNGTYLNDEPVVGDAALEHGDLIKIGSAIFKFISGGNIEALYHEEIYQMTITDGLTQINNKRYFVDCLEREIARSTRHHRELSVVMIDLDHFKAVNDTHGHLAGDRVLRQVAELVKARVRREDVLARFGGEEFALLLPETSLDEAVRFVEKIQALVEETVFSFDDEEIRVTVSIGVAAVDVPPVDALELIKAADQYLYKAKRAGRNRVEAG